MTETFPISRGELESLRYRLKEANELVEPLTHENDRLKMQLADLRTTIAQQQDTINRQAAELAEASELLEQADKRIGDLLAQLAATLTTIEATANDGALYAEGCAP